MSEEKKVKSNPIYRDNNGIKEKLCNECNEFKELISGFYSSGKQGIYSPRCRPCKNKQRREWFLSNEIENKKKLSAWGKEYNSRPEIKQQNAFKNKKWVQFNKDWVKNYNFERNYKLSLPMYIEMVKDRNNECDICGINGSETRLGKLVVDHCHTSNYVRGLLCINCNLGIGSLKDNIKNLIKAAEYITEFKKSLESKNEQEDPLPSSLEESIKECLEVPMEELQKVFNADETSLIESLKDAPEIEF